MPDLARQIRERIAQRPKTFPGLTEDSPTRKRQAEWVEGAAAALLAVLDLTEAGEPWPPGAQDGRDYCEREIDAEVEARDARIVEAIAEGLGVEVDRD